MVKTLRIDPLTYLYENYITYQISNEFKFSGYNLLVALSAHSKSAFVLVGSWPKPLSERIEFQLASAQDIGPMATAVLRACACCIENFGLRKVQCGLGPVVRECVNVCKESSVEPDAHDSTRLIKPGPKWFHKTSDYFKPCQCWDNTRTNHNKPGFWPSEDSYMTSRSSANGQVVFLFGKHECVPKLFSQCQGFHGSVRVAIGRLPATGLQSQHSIFNQFQPSQYISAMGSWGFRNVCTCLTRVSMAYASASTSAWDAGRPRGFVLVSVLKTSRNNVSFGLITVRYNLIRCKWCNQIPSDSHLRRTTCGFCFLCRLPFCKWAALSHRRLPFPALSTSSQARQTIAF